MVKAGIGKGQARHPALMQVDVEIVSFGTDGCERFRRGVEGRKCEPQPRQRNGMPPDTGPQVQHACAGGKGRRMDHHFRLGLGPLRRAVGCCPFGVPVFMRGIGHHLAALQMSLDRIQLLPCSTATTRISIIRMMVSASS